MPASDRIRWIAFDAVGTLIFPDPPVAEAYWRIGTRFGSRLGEDEIRRRFRETFRRSERNDFGTGGVESWAQPDRLTTSEAFERERWRQIVAEVIDDLPDLGACFDALFQHFGSPAAWILDPEAATVLPKLAQAGYRLAVASNFDRRLEAVIDGKPELRSIELRAVSSVLGYRKPSTLFYRRLVEAAGCRPDEILMVGDDYENDVLAAQRAGLQAIQLVRSGPASPGQIARLAELVDLLRA